jgi:hypothetical protein
VVTGDEHHRHPEAADELLQGIAEQLNRIDGRHRAVVQVAGDDDRVRVDLGRQLDQLVEHVSLILGEVHTVENPAQMPVCRVNEAHRARAVSHGVAAWAVTILRSRDG